MSLALVDRLGGTELRVTGNLVASFLAVLGSVFAMVMAIGWAAPDSPAWPGLLIGLAAAVAVVAPDGFAGLATLLGYSVWWLLVAAEAPLLLALVAATAGLVFHVALAHTAAGPSGISLEPQAAFSLFAGVGIIAVGTAALTVIVIGIRGSFETPAAAVGLTLAVVALLPWLAATGSGQEDRLPRPRD